MGREDLVKESPFKTFDNLLSSTRNPVCYSFKDEKCKVDLDRCELARDIYEKLFDVKSQSPDFGGERLWSFDTINSFQTSYNNAFKLYFQNIDGFSLPKGRKGISKKWIDENHEINLKNLDYRKFMDLNFINHFRYWSTTIGNFTPIPYYTLTKNKFITSTNNVRTEFFDFDIELLKKAFKLMSFVDREFCESNNGVLDFEKDYIRRFSLEEYFNNNKKILFMEREKATPKDIIAVKLCILEMIIRIIKRGQRMVEKGFEQKHVAKEMLFSTEKNIKINQECGRLIKIYEDCKLVQSCENCQLKQCVLNTVEEIIDIPQMYMKT